MQLGVLPFGTVLMSALAGQYPQYVAADLPGIGADMAGVRAAAAAFRPYLERDLRQRHGVELLAIYAYPAQVLFCKKPLAKLTDLAGRRVRVSSVGQADFVGALGALPVHTAFAQIMHSLESGDTECAITGTLSGHTLGLYAMFYDIRHVQMMGRVMSGKGGDIIMETASRVMDEEYPDVAFRPEAPDEKTRRVGQSAAAASLPELK